MNKAVKEVNWKFNIGDIVKNEYRDVTILDREIRVKEYIDKYGRHHVSNKKYYKYKCNICNHIDWVHEHTFDQEERDFHICNRFNNFIYEVGEHIKDEKRDLIIKEREYRHIEKDQYQKWCRYHCNICGWDNGWSKEANIKKGNGCACCAGKVLVKGINDIATTNPEILKYLVDINDGYLYTKGDRKKIKCKCPECGLVEYKYICDLIRYGFLCHRCSDGISYPEKFLYSMLNQLNIFFETQLSKTTYKWCDKYYYDIYFVYNNEPYIIEIHGMQHYENKYNFYGKQNTFLEQQKIDKEKIKLANKNGIRKENYIVLDCRYSIQEYIVNSIMNSPLSAMFNFEIVDFKKCNEYAMSSKMVQVCKYYEDHKPIKIIELAKIFHSSRSTIRSYLYNGDNSGIIHYDWEEQKKYQTTQTGKRNSKKVEMFDINANSLGIYESGTELSRKSEDLFGIKIPQVQISRICRGESKNYKNLYTFKYID